MSFLICGRKKRKVEEKKGHKKLPIVEISPATLDSPEHSVLSPDIFSPADIDEEEILLTKSSVTFSSDITDINSEVVKDLEPEKAKHNTAEDGNKVVMATQQDIIDKLRRENESLKGELDKVKTSQGSKSLEQEITKLKMEVESLRSQNSALQKGLKDVGLSAKIMEDREEKLRTEEHRIISERESVKKQIEDCYAKMRPILAREATRQEEVEDLKGKLAGQNRSSRRIFELMERLMVEWKQNVLLRAEVKKLKTLILSSSRSLNNITRSMDDNEYKTRGAIKTEVSKVVKVTYDSKREVIQYQQVINDALDCMLAIRQLQKSDNVTHAGDYLLAVEKLQQDNPQVAEVIGQSWRKVGRNLGFTTLQLRDIETANVTQKPEQIAWKILEKWTENTEDESLLLGNFITALRESEIDTSIGPMPDDDATVLQRLNTYLHDTLKQVNGVIPFMYGFGLITSTMKRFIENGGSDKERVRRLLSIVPTLGEHTLPIFSEILRLGGHDQVAEQIGKEQLKVRLERSDITDKSPSFIDHHFNGEAKDGSVLNEENGNTTLST